MNLARVVVLSLVVSLVGWVWPLASLVRAADSPPPPTFHYRGVVVDQMTRPVAGATVSMIGAGRAATTDATGAFYLTGNVPAGSVQQERRPAAAATVPLLEVSANGHEPGTFRPDSPTMTGLTCMIRSFAEPKAGDPVDLGRWGYIYRKGFAANPPEARWLPPDDVMLCGILWESMRPLKSLEIEFASEASDIPDAGKLTAACNIGSRGKWPSWWLSPKVGDPMTPVASAPSSATPKPVRSVFAFPAGVPCDKAAIRHAGAGKGADRFVIHAYGDAKWRTPLDIEIEWGFDAGGKHQRWDGHIEAFQGHVTGIQPLVAGGVAMAGQRHWRDNPDSSQRRGILARVWLTDNPTQGYNNQTPYYMNSMLQCTGNGRSGHE
ncbi:MAG: carboxypeptidase-like regulatory domain-containing protein [Verrucomicrobia bacterium]|nr:carboxypeptidase-like regulatory domain-containing protein [Verrucomicrobiota bacterium]